MKSIKNVQDLSSKNTEGYIESGGGAMDIRQAELWSPTRIVIIEFPDSKSARNFIDSEEYAPIKAMRLNNAECTLFIVEGE
nr:DUF1330 domain-containing protein [Desulforhopalus sp. IMCC35007]